MLLSLALLCVRDRDQERDDDQDFVEKRVYFNDALGLFLRSHRCFHKVHVSINRAGSNRLRSVSVGRAYPFAIPGAGS